MASGPLGANDDRHLHSLTASAMAGAFILMAHQVAAKAARDSLFLSYFPATDLPKVVGVAALVGVLNAFLFARLLRRSTPANTLAGALGLSMLLHVAEYLFIGANRGTVVVLTYFHIISSSSISLSLLWSIASEAFSPGEAKRYYGRITAAGTAGGILGGLLAERAAVAVSLDAMLLLLAALHGVALIAIVRLRGQRGGQAEVEDTGHLIETFRSAIGRAPFLRNLAMLVLFITISTAVIDFLFKSTAAASMQERGPALARFFAFFYTGTQVVSFLVQATITPVALRSLGLGRSVMAMPLTLVTGAVASLFAPVLAVFTATRAGEAVLRGSLYRAGYELFFTPIPAREKRGVKTAIDVGFDRMGEIVAAILIQSLLVLGMDAVLRPLLVVTIVIGAICVWIAARMDAAYLRALEQGLVQRAIEIDEADIQDSTTLSGLMRSMPRIAKVETSAPELERKAPQSRVLDPSLEYVRVLRSGVAADVRKMLASRPYDALAVPQEIRLLAWDDVTNAARERLESHGARITGQLADALLDSDLDFNVRRRIPRILAHIASQRVVEALQDVLDDPRFEIRYQSSRVLEYLHRTHENLRFDHDRIMLAVERDLSVSRTIWQGRRVLGGPEDTDNQISYLGDVATERADQSMEHVFSLLAIVLPREPLKVAFRSLSSEDRVLRGLGFEYLETALPGRTFHLFRTVLSEPRA